MCFTAESLALESTAFKTLLALIQEQFLPNTNTLVINVNSSYCRQIMEQIKECGIPEVETK